MALARSYWGEKFGVESELMDPMEDLWRYLIPGSRRRERARRKAVTRMRDRRVEARVERPMERPFAGEARLAKGLREYDEFQALLVELDRLMREQRIARGVAAGEVAMLPIRRRAFRERVGTKGRGVVEALRQMVEGLRGRAERVPVEPPSREYQPPVREVRPEEETAELLERMRRRREETRQARSREATRRIYTARIPQGRLGAAALRYLAEQARG